MKKKGALLAVAIVILLAVVLLPIPQHKDILLQGARMAEGELDESVTISVKGWYLNYALRENEFRGTLTIKPFATETEDNAEYEIKQKLFSLSDSVKYISVFRYSEKLNEYVPANVYFSENLEKVLIIDEEDKEAYYVAASETDADLIGLVDLFLKE